MVTLDFPVPPAPAMPPGLLPGPDRPAEPREAEHPPALPLVTRLETPAWPRVFPSL